MVLKGFILQGGDRELGQFIAHKCEEAERGETQTTRKTHSSHGYRALCCGISSDSGQILVNGVESHPLIHKQRTSEESADPVQQNAVTL